MQVAIEEMVHAATFLFIVIASKLRVRFIRYRNINSLLNMSHVHTRSIELHRGLFLLRRSYLYCLTFNQRVK